jgi:hypothetical protein
MKNTPARRKAGQGRDDRHRSSRRHPDHPPPAGRDGQDPAGRAADPGLADHYQKLARAKNLPMQIEELPGRAWIRVQVPANADRDDVLAILDTARGFLGEAEAAAQQERTPAETTVREWWARQRRF